MTSTPNAYEDAIDLLDADHKAVKKLFMNYTALCEDDAPFKHRQHLAEKICQELTVHAQIEEEIFYPAVREAIGDDALMDEARQEHAQAKDLIARIRAMNTDDDSYDAAVKQLEDAITEHVKEEREQMFLQARHAALDLKALAVPLLTRKMQLKKQAQAAMKEAA